MQQQLGKVQAHPQDRTAGGRWAEFLQRTEWVVSLYSANDPNARIEEELLRAELQYSPCLDQAAHTDMHERLDREWGGP